jgi:hypothetical protein
VFAIWQFLCYYSIIYFNVHSINLKILDLMCVSCVSRNIFIFLFLRFFEAIKIFCFGVMGHNIM